MTDFTKANKEAFDKFAATYDTETWQLELARLLTECLQQNKDWLGARWANGDGREVKLLDYACGTGAASIALKSFVTKIRGIDLSEGMITRYNEVMSKLDLSPEQAHGVVADLTTPESKDLPEAADTYDVAIISLALHHVDDAETVLKALADRLNAGGVLIVTDFLPFKHAHHGHGHGHGHEQNVVRKMAHTIKQHGFTEEQMAELYKAIGLQDFGFKVHPERVSIGTGTELDKERDLFIARGKKAV